MHNLKVFFYKVSLICFQKTEVNKQRQLNSSEQ